MFLIHKKLRNAPIPHDLRTMFKMFKRETTLSIMSVMLYLEKNSKYSNVCSNTVTNTNKKLYLATERVLTIKFKIILFHKFLTKEQLHHDASYAGA